VGDRLGVEQRGLEGLRGRDVRTRCAGADSEAAAGPRNDRPAVARHLALLDHIVEQRGHQHHDIERLAGLDLLLEGGGEAEGEVELVPGGALELRGEVEHDLAKSVRAQDLDLGPRRAAAEPRKEARQREPDRTRTHVLLPRSFFGACSCREPVTMPDQVRDRLSPEHAPYGYPGNVPWDAKPQ